MSMSKKPSTFVPGIQSLTAGISTTMVLLLLGLVAFGLLTARGLATHVREHLTFAIIVSDDAREADILKMKRRLEGEPFVREAVYISKKEALKEHTEAMGTDPQEFLGYNPFKASIEIKLKADYANADSIAWIEEKIKQRTNIQEVLYQRELVDAMNRNIRTISLALLELAAVLTLISFTLINNTIRLTIYAKRFAIHTMTLVGASWSFIRRPFLAHNFWIGVCSALVADALLWCAAYWVVQQEPDLTAIVTTRVMLLVSAFVLLMGVLITTLCALFSINRFLRMKASTLYYI